MIFCTFATLHTGTAMFFILIAVLLANGRVISARWNILVYGLLGMIAYDVITSCLHFTPLDCYVIDKRHIYILPSISSFTDNNLECLQLDVGYDL